MIILSFGFWRRLEAHRNLSFPICLLHYYTNSLSHSPPINPSSPFSPSLFVATAQPSRTAKPPPPYLKFITQSTMAGYFVSEPMQRNMITRKRKELGQLDQVNEDLSDFSLSSPATKIRRLDAQLPPILEEEEVEFDLAGNNGSVIEAELENQERAIVPFNPVNNPILHNPSNVSISLSPDLVSGFKDRFVRSSYYYDMKSEEEQDSRNQCTAVVPWVPSQLPSMPATEVSQSDDLGEPMEDEDMGAAAMEIEENSTPASGAGGTSNGCGGGIWASNGEGFPWQQQHCMIPQPPQNTSTPITWFR